MNIDIETCPACGLSMRIIACIEHAAVIEKILAQLDAKAAAAQPLPAAAVPGPARGARAVSPQAGVYPAYTRQRGTVSTFRCASGRSCGGRARARVRRLRQLCPRG